MASLLDTRFYIRTAAGVPVSGGKLRIYDANTTTLSTVYSDAALSVPLTNPVVADSGGFLPQVFLAAGNYDLATLTAGDVLIKAQDDVPSLGSDSATFTKDFTNSRVAIRGSGGVVYTDFGDASPDNTGGTGSIGGWLGTQADLITINAASVNAGTTAGALKENSKKLASVVYTEATTVSAASSVDIPLTASPTGALAWEIDIWDYSQSGNGNMRARLSYDSGSTYKAGAADYTSFWDYSESAGTTGTGGSGAAAQIELNSNMNGAANQLGWVSIRIITPNSGSDHTALDANSRGLLNVGTKVQYRAMGWGQGGYGRATHLRLLMSANTFTFKYLVRPLRGFGET